MKLSTVMLLSVLGAVITACDSDSPIQETGITVTPPAPAPIVKSFTIIQGVDNNRKANALLSLNSGGPGGSSNQSLRGGDILVGTEADDILIGGLGVDVLMGNDGDDILIGGTEDFNSSVDGDARGSDNKDRAFGQAGDDVFIWTPGDGSDYFDGGPGTDVLIFGVIGEATDNNGSSTGAPFFSVNPPSAEGSQDFDGIFLDENSQPRIRSSNSPGFCTILDAVVNRENFETLKLDHVIRFSIRGIANAFDAEERTDDDGTRVALSIENTEFVVCTRRDFDENATLENIEVFDISGEVPVLSDIEELPEYVQDLII